MVMVRSSLEFEETDITVWEDANGLYKRLKNFEKKLPPRGTIIELTHEDMEYFLRYESNLLWESTISRGITLEIDYLRGNAPCATVEDPRQPFGRNVAP